MEVLLHSGDGGIITTELVATMRHTSQTSRLFQGICWCMKLLQYAVVRERGGRTHLGSLMVGFQLQNKCRQQNTGT